MQECKQPTRRRERCLFLTLFMVENSCSHASVDSKIVRTPNGYSVRRFSGLSKSAAHILSDKEWHMNYFIWIQDQNNLIIQQTKKHKSNTAAVHQFILFHAPMTWIFVHIFSIKRKRQDAGRPPRLSVHVWCGLVRRSEPTLSCSICASSSRCALQGGPHLWEMSLITRLFHLSLSHANTHRHC